MRIDALTKIIREAVRAELEPVIRALEAHAAAVQPSEWTTVAEAALMLRVCERQVRRYISEGRLVSRKNGSSKQARVVVERASVIAMGEAQL